MKLTSEQLSDVIIESMALSVSLLERFEIMNENDLFAQRAKQSLKNTLPHIEAYVNKLIKPSNEEETLHYKKAGTVISELSQRIEKAVTTENIMDISARQSLLKEILYEEDYTNIELIYDKIILSEILNY